MAFGSEGKYQQFALQPGETKTLFSGSYSTECFYTTIDLDDKMDEADFKYRSTLSPLPSFCGKTCCYSKLSCVIKRNADGSLAAILESSEL